MSLDVLLDTDGDLAPVSHLGTGDAVTLQRVAIRLSIMRGECPLDQQMGLPVIEWLRTKPVDLLRVSADVRKLVEACPGVAALENLDVVQVEEEIRITGLVRSSLTGAAVPLIHRVGPGGPNLALGLLSHLRPGRIGA
jgi:hypothetical protein